MGEAACAQATLDSLGDAVLSMDLWAQVTYLNPVAERLTGWTSSDAAGRPVAEVFTIVHAGTRAPAPNPLIAAMEQDRAVGLTPDCVLIGRDGHETAIEDSASPIHDERRRLVGAVIVFRDVTKTRAIADRLSHLATHDALTDLPNRRVLRDRLQQAIALSRRHARRFAILYVDLDAFKPVNDVFGHKMGDRLLQSVATRINACVRDADTVSRVGGDEFVIVLSEIITDDGVEACARKLVASLAVPFRLEHRELLVTASVGISYYPDDGLDPDSLIHAADAAMFRAKRAEVAIT
ncbi:MAG: diguanylate cyclase [Chloroflexota bacterium]